MEMRDGRDTNWRREMCQPHSSQHGYERWVGHTMEMRGEWATRRTASGQMDETAVNLESKDTHQQRGNHRNFRDWR